MDSAAAARYVGLSARTLEHYRRVGGGPRFIKHARNVVRYDVRDLDAWLDSRKRASTSVAR
jgi:DNA-binding transcriptional MerR regulator